MRYAEIAEVLLRLLDGGAAAEVKSRRAADESAEEERLWAFPDGGGSGAAEELLRLLDGGASATAVKLRRAAAELLRSARPTLEEHEDGTEFGMAEAAPYRVEPRENAPGEEAEELPMRTRYGGPAGETAARRRETELETRARFQLRQSPEDAEGALAKTQERQRLGAALEALSDGRSRLALLQEANPRPGTGLERIIETGGAAVNGGLSFSAAAAGNGDARSYGAAAGYGGGARSDSSGSGAAARDFPSSETFTSFSGGDPEAVSEFFRRDSRRYDATFGG